MASIRIGQNSAVQQQSSHSYTPDAGQITTTRFIGTQAECEARFFVEKAQNRECHITPLGGGRAEIVTTYQVDRVTTWELDIVWNERAPGQSNKFRAFFDALSTDSARGEFIGITEGIRTTDETGTLPAAFPGKSETYKAWVWDIIYDHGVLEPTATLRRVVTYPAGAVPGSFWTDVNKVWTTAQITSIADPPSSIVGVLPTAHWLMLSDSAAYGADGRFTVVTLWVTGTYPSHKYTAK